MKGTHNEEVEAIQKSDEEFEADQGRGEICKGNWESRKSHSGRPANLIGGQRHMLNFGQG